MDMYSSQNRSVAKGPIRFESEAALEAFIEKSSRPRVRMSVEGFNPYRPEDEIKRELVNHFESCGEDFRVIVPADPIVDSRFGIMVKGYDTSLPADEVESVLRTHFSSCGEITHVYISTPNNRANIYFSEEEGEALALGLHGSEVRGFRITTRRLATVRSNPLLAPGQTRRIGYTAPAHLIEFAPEIRRKVMAFKRIKRTMKKVMAFKRMKRTLKTSLSLFYHLAPSKAQCMMTLLFVCVWMIFTPATKLTEEERRSSSSNLTARLESPLKSTLINECNSKSENPKNPTRMPTVSPGANQTRVAEVTAATPLPPELTVLVSLPRLLVELETTFQLLQQLSQLWPEKHISRQNHSSFLALHRIFEQLYLSSLYYHVAKSLGLLFPQTLLSTDVLLLFFLDMAQKRRRCNLMGVTSEIGMPLLSLFGIAVLGYDTSLPEDEIESKLTANFSSCGKITHVFVCPLDECTNIYFSKEEGEASALDLNGSEVGGFKITTMRVATVRSNPPLAPGETRIGYSIPAHFIEFARENEEKLNDYMTK
ncbi:BnaC04g56660D [Brassica napus]|uniref:RRM domain-containing protein n=3 Tax=Brassica TaxID=3705 RepID=A0A0D3C4Y4_BRAOL|nr:unnamed protein product [Brassica napus]CDY64197.1 BnaC04g56660D [Brassica napus]VDD15438.1 unnamed protein product [Brassica oleracea]